MSSFNKKFNNLDLSIHGVRLPNFQPDKNIGIKVLGSDNFSLLKSLCNEGMKKIKAKIT